MKKIFVILLCAFILCTMPIVAFAEGESVNEEITVTEGETSASEETVTEKIVDYVTENIDKVVVIIVMMGYSIVESRIRGKMNGSIGTLNNNAIAIAKNSGDAINTALKKIDEYDKKFDSIVEMLIKSEEEKKALTDALVNVESYLKTAKLANIEFANELAELLCLANIPNSKKDELYKKHLEGVHKLEAGEVKSNDGTEA